MKGIMIFKAGMTTLVVGLFIVLVGAFAGDDAISLFGASLCCGGLISCLAFGVYDMWTRL